MLNGESVWLAGFRPVDVAGCRARCGVVGGGVGSTRGAAGTCAHAGRQRGRCVPCAAQLERWRTDFTRVRRFESWAGDTEHGNRENRGWSRVGSW